VAERDNYVLPVVDQEGGVGQGCASATSEG